MTKAFGDTPESYQSPAMPRTGTESMHVPMGDVLSTGTPTQHMPHPANEPFVYAHNPKCWEIVDGELLPQMRRFAVSPGINGTDSHGNPTAMIAGLMQNGWTVLNPRDPKVGTYAHGTRVRAGVHWHAKWEELRALGGQRLDSRIDTEGFNAWRRGLVAQGVIAPPTQDYIDIAMHRARRTARRIRTDSAHSRQLQRQAEERIDDISSAVQPGEVVKVKRGSLLSGNAAADRKACAASDDADALRKALRDTQHKTVERVIKERLEKLGEPLVPASAPKGA